jgi:5-methylthioadenosine/S-adenosylhomocysteine deaminase
MLIKNATILTMESDKPEYLHANLGIKGNRIVFIGDIPDNFEAATEIDGTGKVLLPGLINSHSHIAMSLMRHSADDLPFWTWLNDRIMPLEHKLNGADVYTGSMLSIAEMIRSGITTFADMYFFVDEIAQAVCETGIRANLSRGLVFNSPDDISKIDESLELFHKWHNSNDGKIKIDLGPHAPYTCGPEYLNKISKIAGELGTGIHIHISESRREVEEIYSLYKKSPVEYVRDCGIFENKTYAAHCVKVTDDDIAILAENNVSVMNNPGSNLKFGNGFAPVSKMLDAGINVSLGTDGPASNNNLNMFEEMNLTALVNKAADHSPTSVPAYTALKMATINGAKALGIENETGSIKVGKKADIIIIDLNKPHFYPKVNIASSLVYSAQASDVCSVICDGRLLMRDRQLLTIDELKVCRDADIAAKKLMGKNE